MPPSPERARRCRVSVTIVWGLAAEQSPPEQDASGPFRVTMTVSRIRAPLNAWVSAIDLCLYLLGLGDARVRPATGVSASRALLAEFSAAAVISGSTSSFGLGVS